MTNYATIREAAESLLGEVVSILGERNDYAVIGGWSPLLLNSGPIEHPGTRDVDLLFRDARQPGVLASVIQRLCDRGYTRSAKHEFQLLRVLPVNNIEFVFNVDLLHPSDEQDQVADFVEHLELPVPLREYCDEKYWSMSLNVPNAEFIFHGHYDMISRQFLLPDGSEAQFNLPVMTEGGTVITKSGTCLHPKRLRDAFDVYIAINQARNRDKLLREFREIRNTHPLAFNSLFKLREFLDGRSNDLQKRVADIVAKIDQNSRPKGYDEQQQWLASMTAPMTDLLRDIPLPEKALRSYDKPVQGAGNL